MIIRNFLFHRVSDKSDALWPPMHPELFERIIRFLTSHYDVVLLEKFLEDPTEFQHKKSIATVLFDDGYKDNAEIAAPTLLRYKCPASFYVVTDCIDKGLPTWTYLTDHFFQTNTHTNIFLKEDFVPSSFRQIQWHSSEEGIQWGKKIKPWMKSLPNEQRLWVMEQFTKNDGVESFQNLMMSWKEVKQLYDNGFYIGSHSHTHPMLGNLASAKEINEELEISAQRLQQHLGYRPITISYPIGSWDERVVKAAKDTGYKYGLAVEQKFYNNEKDDLFTIPRTELYNESWLKTKLRINGVYQRIRKLVR